MKYFAMIVGLILVLVIVFFGIFLSNSRAAYDGPVTQIKNSCFTSSRVLEGAIELYDMEHSDAPMKKLDIALLKSGNYLKGEIHGCNPDCEFEADLLGRNPIVWCKKHGNTEKPTPLTKEIFARESSFWGRLKTRVKIFFGV